MNSQCKVASTRRRRARRNVGAGRHLMTLLRVHVHLTLIILADCIVSGKQPHSTRRGGSSFGIIMSLVLFAKFLAQCRLGGEHRDIHTGISPEAAAGERRVEAKCGTSLMEPFIFVPTPDNQSMSYYSSDLTRRETRARA